MCIVDVTGTTIYLLRSAIFTSRSFADTLDNVLATRFDEVENGHTTERLEVSHPGKSAESPQVLRKDTLFRWLLFIFAGVLPGIKAATLYGLPWSKAWAIMYMISFVVVEILIAASKRRNRRILLTETPPLEKSWNAPPTASSAAIAQQRYDISVELAYSLLLGILIQLVLLVWGIVSFWAKFGWLPARFDFGSLGTSLSTSVIVSMGDKFSLSMTAENAFFWNSSRLQYSGGAGELSKLSFWMWLIAMLVILHLIGLDLSSLPLHFLPFIVHMLFIYIHVAGRRWPKLVSYLSLEASQDNVHSDMDGMAVLSLIFFLSHIFVALAWYSFVYDPQLTYSPGWVRVFG